MNQKNSALGIPRRFSSAENRFKGGIARIVATGMRGRIEKIFGTWKRCYGLRRMRWRGLAKAAVQVHLTAIAYNLKRTMNILAAQA